MLVQGSTIHRERKRKRGRDDVERQQGWKRSAVFAGALRPFLDRRTIAFHVCDHCTGGLWAM